MTNPFFPEIHGIFGLGCMRFPKIGEEIDKEQVCRMVDAFLEAGFNGTQGTVLCVHLPKNKTGCITFTGDPACLIFTCYDMTL